MINLIRLRGFGDVIWVEPVVRRLIDLGKQVNVLTLNPEALLHFPSPNFHLNKKIGSYLSEPIHFMNYENTPKRHILESYRSAARVSEMELSYPRIYLTEQEKVPLLNGRYVVLHLEPTDQNFRKVHGVEWDRVVGEIRKRGLEVIQISLKNEQIYGTRIPLKNWRQIMSLIYHAAYFIGCDSGPSHIAASLNIPSLLFFGSVNPAYRHLSSFRGLFLQGTCLHQHCYHEVISICGQPCRIVGDAGEPPCCTFTTKKVLEAIDRLFKTYLESKKE